MANFNKVILAGNLTRDPEVRYTPKAPPSPSSVWPSIAVGKNEAGETKEEVTFVDVDAFGRTAEVISQYRTSKKAALSSSKGVLSSISGTTNKPAKNAAGSASSLKTFNFSTPDAATVPVVVARAPRPLPRHPAPLLQPEAPEPESPAPEEDDVPF